MGIKCYKRKRIPLIESTLSHKDIVYGLASSKSGKSYYLYDLGSIPISLKMHINVEKGLKLTLGKKENEFGVFYISSDGMDEGFTPLPI